MKARFFSICLALSLIAVLCLVYGFFIEPKRLVIRNVEIQSDNWDGNSLKIALLSDLHIGGYHVPAERAGIIAMKVRALNADIVLLPGDFVSGHTPLAERDAYSNNQVNRGLYFLSLLRSKQGVFATIGNHDVWYNPYVVSRSLEDAGIIVLDNAAHHTDGGICVVGLADQDTQTVDVAAFNACKPGSNIIAIMHSPDSFQYLPSDTALAVAGHTHGGQINIPVIGRRVTPTRSGRKYAYGLLDVNGIPAFVTAGIGTSIIPARFRAPPEIVVITLKSAG